MFESKQSKINTAADMFLIHCADQYAFVLIALKWNKKKRNKIELKPVAILF